MELAGALGAGIDLGSGGFGFHVPEMLPFGFPGGADFTFAHILPAHI